MLDLNTHFEVYRGCIHRDLLEGSIDAAKNTLLKTEGTRFKTAYDLLQHCVAEIKKHIQFNDIYSYKKTLQTHQKYMLALLTRLSQKYLMEYTDVLGTNNEIIRDFIKEKGWGWFKFNSHYYIHKNKYRVIPRWYLNLTTPFDVDVDDPLLTITTDELCLCAKHGVDPMQIKESNEVLIGFQDRDPIKISLDKLNCGDQVHDWTAPLFRGGIREN